MSKLPEPPFSYFEDLLQKNKLSFLKSRFINSFVGNRNYIKINSINEEEGIINYVDVFYDPKIDDAIEANTSISFKSQFYSKLESESTKSLINILNKADSILIDGKNPHQYLSFQTEYLQRLIDKAALFYKEEPKLEKVLQVLKKNIEEKYNIQPSLSSKSISRNPDEYSPNSFLFDSKDEKSRKETLHNLYKLLTKKPSIISCSEDDFINAFSQKKVENGIRWLIKGKNGKTSKSSLFYFIDQLNQGYIEPVENFDINKKVAYIFRDLEGNELKHIRQSKNVTSTKPTGQDRIDQILFDLFK